MCADDSHDQLIANMTEFVQQYLRDTPVISTDVPSVALLDVASDEPTPSTSMTATYTSQWETEIQLFFIFYYEQEAKLSLGYPTVLPHSTFEGHVTSSVTWPFNSPCTISDWWSFGTESLSPAVFEILCSKCIRVTSLTFLDNVLHDIAKNPHHKSKVRHRLTTTFLRRRYCTLMFALHLHDHRVHARWSFKCFARSLYQLCTESYTRHAVYIDNYHTRYYSVSIMHQLWNSIAQNGKDRSWWHLAKIFTRL